ncbi:hypothetical protein [Clostridium sp.]|uniref:hypothetical protein n=1 Tax=Clostridium sp. TaxID=1506 RepID=UPI0026DBCAAE|nr:hypothetical protein [Clostridium sp.]MDO5039168.1 hypothetical protein [Clostridium sp.]
MGIDYKKIGKITLIIISNILFLIYSYFSTMLWLTTFTFSIEGISIPISEFLYFFKIVIVLAIIAIIPLVFSKYLLINIIITIVMAMGWLMTSINSPTKEIMNMNIYGFSLNMILIALMSYSIIIKKLNKKSDKLSVI